MLFVEGWFWYNAVAEVTKHQLFCCGDLSSFISHFFFLFSIAYFYCFSTFSSFFALYFSSLFFFFCFLFIAFFFLDLLSPFFNFLIRNVIVPLLFFLIFLSYFLTSLPPFLFLSYTSHKRRSKSEQLNSVLEFKRCANVSFHLSSSFNST